jgi:pimeloyl-ACP methyl ester carboxylesterase
MDDIVTRALGALLDGGVTGGELDRGGRALRWIAAGTGGPTVVLEAASGTPALTWTPVLPSLAAHTRVVVYDRAGLGMSDPAEPPTFESEIADLTAVLEQVGGGPCVLVGNSWGAQLVEILAWSRPDLVAGLVLVDPAHEEFQPWIARLVQPVAGRLLILGILRGAALASLRKEAAAKAAKASADPRVQDLLVEAHLACYAHTYQFRTMQQENRMRIARGKTIRRLRAAAAPITVPFVVLSATGGVPPRMRARWTALQAESAAAVDGGEHVVVADSGHHIHDSRPEAVTGAVLGVLERARAAADPAL